MVHERKNKEKIKKERRYRGKVHKDIHLQIVYYAKGFRYH